MESLLSMRLRIKQQSTRTFQHQRLAFLYVEFHTWAPGLYRPSLCPKTKIIKEQTTGPARQMKHCNVTDC